MPKIHSAILTYEEVKTLFLGDNPKISKHCSSDVNPSTFRCIMGSRCGQMLTGERLDDAYDLVNENAARRCTIKACKVLTGADETPCVHKIRDLIYCLICYACQQPDHWARKEVEKAWKDQFAATEFFGRRTHHSDYCLTTAKSARKSISTRLDSPATKTSNPSKGHAVAAAEKPSSWLGFSMGGVKAKEIVTEVCIDGDDDDDKTLVGIATPESNSKVAAEANPASHKQDRNSLAAADGIEDTPDLSSPASRGVSTEPQSPCDRSTRFSRTSPKQTQILLKQYSDFAPGPDAFKAPDVLLSLVKDILLQPIDEHGSIYAIRVANVEPSIVKIGITKGVAKHRFSQIQRQQCVKLDEGKFFTVSGIFRPRLARLEKLVHADLASYNRVLRNDSGKKAKTHKEFYEVDLTEAERTINRWVSFVTNFMNPQGEMANGAIITAIQEEERQLRANGPAQPTSANDDHDRREEMWQRILPVVRTPRKETPKKQTKGFAQTPYRAEDSEEELDRFRREEEEAADEEEDEDVDEIEERLARMSCRARNVEPGQRRRS